MQQPAYSSVALTILPLFLKPFTRDQYYYSRTKMAIPCVSEPAIHYVKSGGKLQNSESYAIQN